MKISIKFEHDFPDNLIALAKKNPQAPEIEEMDWDEQLELLSIAHCGSVDAAEEEVRDSIGEYFFCGRPIEEYMDYYIYQINLANKKSRAKNNAKAKKS